MRQRRWLELFKDYDYIIDYHRGKANVVAAAFSRKMVSNLAPQLSHPQPPPRQMKGARNFTGILYLLFQTLVGPSLITESKYHVQRYKIKLPP